MIFISKIFPNPAGKDTLGEFIEVFNKSDKTISLKGWCIGDKSEKTYCFSDNTLIQANTGKKFFYSQTKISLNNSGDEISLFSVNKNIVDTIIYNKTVKDNVAIFHSSPFSALNSAFENIVQNDNSDEYSLASIERNETIYNNNSIQVGQIYNNNIVPIAILCVTTSFILTIVFWYLYQIVQKRH